MTFTELRDSIGSESAIQTIQHILVDVGLTYIRKSLQASEHDRPDVAGVGILSGFGNAELGTDPLYLTIAIGCGSKPFPWMNDSGFWVISKMSGMTESETLRSFAVLLTIMGFTGLIATILLATIFPFPFGQG